jgi:hypothetical protein
MKAYDDGEGRGHADTDRIDLTAAAKPTGEAAFRPGLPDGIFSSQKSKFG